jgi:transcriptional regulator with XRE-family HTH domain
MDTRQLIGWNLRRNRVSQDISQERLALEAMIDRAYVGRVERGMENVTVSTLEALTQVLKVPVSELFVVPQKATPIPGLRAGRKPKE